VNWRKKENCPESSEPRGKKIKNKDKSDIRSQISEIRHQRRCPRSEIRFPKSEIMTDPIGDMLTRIRNAAAAGISELVLPASKIKIEIAKILERENWIQKFEILGADTAKAKANAAFQELKIVLKYKKSGRSAISSIQRVSKPGLRVYAGKYKMPTVLNGLGIAIVSTSRGLMTAKEAKKEKIGGEVLCEIY
jgi:small subunit ribosomal protein S8